MKVSKLVLQAGVLTIYIFFPAYRYYALGAMIVHGIVSTVRSRRQQLALQNKQLEV